MNLLNKDDVQEAIANAGNYLVQQVGPGGKFVYRVNLDPDINLPERYNMLRHAGTIYALAAFHTINPAPATQSAIHDAVAFLGQTSLEYLPDHDDKAAIWSSAEESKKAGRQAKLGGAGLALLAFADARPLAPPAVDDQEMRALGNFILYMQKEDGSFHSKYKPKKGGRRDKWVSLYYPGEAALGLVRLYEVLGDPRYLSGAKKALGYLARSRKSELFVPADHWALIATRSILPYLEDKLKIDLVHHARQIVDQILQEQMFGVADHLRGGFTPDGRLTPAATRAEGLLAAADLFSPEDEITERLDLAIDHAMRFVLDGQVKSGPYAGAFPRAKRKLNVFDDHYDANFNRRATEIRIDYVQHALSALIDYKHRADRETSDGRKPH